MKHYDSHDWEHTVKYTDCSIWLKAGATQKAGRNPPFLLLGLSASYQAETSLFAPQNWGVNFAAEFSAAKNGVNFSFHKIEECNFSGHRAGSFNILFRVSIGQSVQCFQVPLRSPSTKCKMRSVENLSSRSLPSAPMLVPNWAICPVDSKASRCAPTVWWLTPSPAAICLSDFSGVSALSTTVFWLVIIRLW